MSKSSNNKTKLNTIVSVTDFYANGASGALVDPTGVIDSTLGIQAAINSGANGYQVLFPAGTFLFTEVTISDKTNLTLTGPGILNGMITVNNATIDQGHEINLTFRGLSWNRGRVTAGVNAIKLVKCSGVRITGCHFKGVDKCIAVYGTATHDVHRVTINECTTTVADASLYTAAEINNLPYVYWNTGLPNYFFWNGNAVNTVMTCGDVSITGCNPVFASINHIYTLGQDGLVVTGNTFFFQSYSYRSQIKNQNIYIEQGAFCTITGNNLFEAGTQSVYAFGVSNLIVNGNNIDWAGQRLSSACILVVPMAGDPVTAAVISDNIVRIPTGNGIQIVGAQQFTSVIGNKVITPGGSNFYYGDGTIAAPNGVPAISGTKYGIFSQNVGWQNSFIGNTTMQAYNLIPKSYDTTYGDYRYAGPISKNNIVTAGVDEFTSPTVITTITANTIDTNGASCVYVNTAGGSISFINGGNNGQTLIITVGSNPITLTNNASLLLGTPASITIPVAGTATLVCFGTVWRLISTAL